MFDSIVKYPIGSIWMYISTRKKSEYLDPNANHDFMTSRPVMVVSKYTKLTEKILVAPITSNASKPGFDVILPISGSPISRICPYEEARVSVEYLTQYIGIADPALVNAVMQAIAYHHGFSDELPMYIAEEERLSIEMRNSIISGSYTDYLTYLAKTASPGGHTRQYNNIEMRMRVALGKQQDPTDEEDDDDEYTNDASEPVEVTETVTVKDPPTDEEIIKIHERVVDGIVSASTEKDTVEEEPKPSTTNRPKRYMEGGYPKEFDRLSQAKLDIIRSGDIDRIMQEFGKSRTCAIRWAGQIKAKDGINEKAANDEYDEKVSDLARRVRSKKVNLKFMRTEDAQLFCTIDPSEMKLFFGISPELGKSYQKMYLAGKRGSLNA